MHPLVDHELFSLRSPIRAHLGVHRDFLEPSPFKYKRLMHGHCTYICSTVPSSYAKRQQLCFRNTGRRFTATRPELMISRYGGWTPTPGTDCSLDIFRFQSQTNALPQAVGHLGSGQLQCCGNIGDVIIRNSQPHSGTTHPGMVSGTSHFPNRPVRRIIQNGNRYWR